MPTRTCQVVASTDKGASSRLKARARTAGPGWSMVMVRSATEPGWRIVAGPLTRTDTPAAAWTSANSVGTKITRMTPRRLIVPPMDRRDFVAAAIAAGGGWLSAGAVMQAVQGSQGGRPQGRATEYYELRRYRLR